MARPGVEHGCESYKVEMTDLGLWKKKGANFRPGNPRGAVTVPSVELGRR